MWLCGYTPSNVVLKPTELVVPVPIVQLDAEWDFGLALDVNGCVWKFGSFLGSQTFSNFEREEGIPPAQSVVVQRNFGLILDKEGAVWGTFSDSNKLSYNPPARASVSEYHMRKFSSLIGIQAIAAGHTHCLFLDHNGVVWVYGNNRTGQIGLCETLDVNTPIALELEFPIAAISCGVWHSLLLDVERRVWGCGQNDSGQLGLGDFYFRNTPVNIPNLPQIAVVCAGNNHSLFIDEDGKVWGCGRNTMGELGIKKVSFQNKAVPISLPTKLRKCFLGQEFANKMKSARC